MPVNAHPDYINAEKEFLNAETKEQKIIALKRMISHAPTHKGAENLRAQLKRRLARLKYINEKEIKQKKGGKAGIKKEDMQAVLVGKTNSGKSTLLSLLTNAKPEISSYEFTTKFPIVGMMNYNEVPIQLIEIPAIGSEYYDRGVVNSADTILILIENLSQIQEIEKTFERASGKKIVLFTKSDLLSENEKRKIFATLSSKKYNFQIVSSKTKEGIAEMKEKLFQSFGKIRIYTKEPGKEKTQRPVIMIPESTVKDVAEKILKGFSTRVKETKIWGPSSKYAGQVVGLAHKLKDMDVVEFKTK